MEAGGRQQKRDADKQRQVKGGREHTEITVTALEYPVKVCQRG